MQAAKHSGLFICSAVLFMWVATGGGGGVV